MKSNVPYLPGVTETENNMSTKTVVETLLVVFGSVLLVLFALFGLSTVVTRSTWWYRRRRTYLRRLDHAGRYENIPLEDKLFHYTSYILESMSFTSGESDADTKKMSHRTKLGAKSVTRDECQQPALPLRFQPEKLYGTVSTMHRDNLRKKSWSSLTVQPSISSSRRASMIDSLLHITASPNVKNVSKAAAGTQSWSTQACPRKASEKRWNMNELPQIDITCVCDESEVEATADSYENLATSSGLNVRENLTVTLPARRASSTNFELLNTRPERKLSMNEDSLKKRNTNAHSDVEANPSDLQPRAKKLSFGYVLSKKRPSLRDVIQRGSFLWPDQAHSRTPKIEMDEATKSSTAEMQVKQEKATGSVEPITSLTEEQDQPKLPSTPLTLENGDFAGVIALGLAVDDSTGPTPSKLRIQLLAVKGLKPQRPWQKSTYNLRCICHNSDTTQHASVQFKEADLKILRARKNFEISFDWTSQPDSYGELQIQLFENYSKWSGEKDHYLGSVNIPLRDISMNKPSWYLVVPAYPIIRIKADVLVSLCQRPLEGLLSIGVHEIRNIDFEAYGPWDLENFKQELKHRQIEVAVHACLFHEGHLSKSRKSIFLQRPGYRPVRSRRASVSMALASKVSADSEPTTSDVPFNRLVGGEHFLQFSLPATKKSFGKLPLSDYGVALFFFSKLLVADRLPLECMRQLRSVGASEVKYLNAIGECFIGDQAAQLEHRKQHGLVPKFDIPSSSLWSEVSIHGSSRVYQWLSVE
ncbi:hypothetical protein CSKR_101650 [Clonorchis sinensis]|uniref:Uncharacterized protein n=2 Tax=Clonorchis sinensis TaxID=79923 RepID=H2KP14_CLOSI|nr:hypothetical protein CSKR_101650 [Clonorchis sinensis]GAA35084.2 hypothetical protein CLF_101188 [Clonorchis sinensis]